MLAKAGDHLGPDRALARPSVAHVHALAWCTPAGCGRRAAVAATRAALSAGNRPPHGGA